MFLLALSIVDIAKGFEFYYALNLLRKATKKLFLLNLLIRASRDSILYKLHLVLYSNRITRF
jgi:hypothetical protein